MDRFNRTRLLFGDAAMKKLEKSAVMVVGCGAVGSFAVEALARAGVGCLILIDSDCIEPSNINRQLFALDSTVGMPKVDVAVKRISDINPDIKAVALNTFFDENTNLNLKPDFVVDAIDTVASKIALYDWCCKHKVPFISSMGAARKTDPLHVRLAKLSQTRVCPLAAKIRKIVRNKNLPDFDVVFSAEEPNNNLAGERIFGSVITVTGVFGLVAANYAIQQLINK